MKVSASTIPPSCPLSDSFGIPLTLTATWAHPLACWSNLWQTALLGRRRSIQVLGRPVSGGRKRRMIDHNWSMGHRSDLFISSLSFYCLIDSFRSLSLSQAYQVANQADSTVRMAKPTLYLSDYYYFHFLHILAYFSRTVNNRLARMLSHSGLHSKNDLILNCHKTRIGPCWRCTRVSCFPT